MIDRFMELEILQIYRDEVPSFSCSKDANTHIETHMQEQNDRRLHTLDVF